MPRSRFIAQPFADARDLRDFIRSVAADPALVELEIVVAWAKRSGLSRLQGDLESFRARGGRTSLIVGIDEGGATRQGLDLARTLFDSTHVFHDRSGRTFHPKVYLASGDGSARLLVGSHNATAGGVYFNYEAGIESELDLPADDELWSSVRAFIARLRADEAVCKELTEDVLTELISNPRYRIGDEDARSRSTLPTGAPESLDSVVDVQGVDPAPASSSSIFAASAEPKRGDPGSSGGNRSSRGTRGEMTPSRPTPAPPSPSPEAPTPRPARVSKRWFKKLPRSDAQHPLTGNPTGALRLTKARHEIDWRTYFRRNFFADQDWHTETSVNGMPLEYATVEFEVTINGAPLGRRRLRVDHAPHREQGQNNVPTDLKWGTLSPFLLATDYTDQWVILERLGNDGYRLEITGEAPDPTDFIE